jgi:hypothetical protein
MYWSCCTIFPPHLKEHDWKIILTKVNAGNLKHKLLNKLWSILAVNVLILLLSQYNLSGTVKCLSSANKMFKLWMNYVYNTVAQKMYNIKCLPWSNTVFSLFTLCCVISLAVIFRKYLGMYHSTWWYNL